MIKIDNGILDVSGDKTWIMAELSGIIYALLGKELTKREVIECVEMAFKESDRNKQKTKAKKIFDDGTKAMSVIEISTQNKTKEEIADEIAEAIKDSIESQMEEEDDT